MKLVELKCKNCGGILKVQPGTTDIHCEHCKTNYKLDDEAQHIKYDDMEKAGYDYEKGKLKARQEHELEKQRQKIEAQQAAAKAEKDAKMKKWIILAWIFFFPFMFTYWLWAKGTLDKRIKIMRGRYKNDVILKVRLQISKTNEIYVKLNINSAEIYGYLYK